MTDRTHPEAGSTHIIRYALELGLLWIDGDGRDKVREALTALDALEAKLASIRAGGVQALSAAPEAIAKLRHLYQNMVNGAVRDTASAKRIAEGLLAPAIEALERATPPAEQQAKDSYIKLLADCRDAFPVPEHGSPIENEWIAAVGSHEAVPAYLQAVAKQQAAQKAAAGEPTGKQSLQVQVWVLPNGKGGGQFSWEPQDERFWTKLVPQQAASTAAPVEPDPADIIAGALQISRGHAIEMMREALVAAPQQEAHHLTQALTDPKNQPNQYGVEFGMSGQQMHFKIGNQLFRLAYEPDDQQEFEFMKRMLIHAFSTFTPDVKAAPQPAPQGETNAQLDTDSNSPTPGQQRDVAGPVAVGQPVGHGSDSKAGDPSAQRNKLLTVAERNIRSFLRSAVFKSESDREAALNCVDVLWEAARAPADSGAAPAATVIKKGVDRQWMSERLGHLPDGIYSLYLAPQQEPSRDAKTWCSYVAGMIGCYLKKPDESAEVRAIAGIIERRLWALPAPQPAPAPLSDDTERLEWLLWKLPGDALRYVVGELSDTSSGAEFRAAIDTAIAAQGGKV